MSKFYTYAKAYGSKVLVRGYDNGQPFIDQIKFKPTLFIKSRKETEWKSLYGSYSLEPIQMDSIRDAKDFVERYKDVEGFEVHGFQRYEYQWINEQHPNGVDYKLSDLRINFFDIETVDEDNPDAGFPDIQAANIPIVLISMVDSRTREAIVLVLKDFDMSMVPDHLKNVKFKYIKHSNEKELLKYFIAHNTINKYDAWSGWNTDGFDIPYVVNRINRLFGEDFVKKLSPFGIAKPRDIEIRGSTITTYDIYGIISLDMLELYKRWGTYSAKESYALGFIAQEELGHTKVDLPGKNFWDNYVNHTAQFIVYSAIDSQLVIELDDKMKLIDLAFSLAYVYRCNIQDVFRTVQPWEVFIFNHLAFKKIAVPPRKNPLRGHVEGAWVKEPVPGMYGWCVGFDFSSLYPSIIRQWNISPETFIAPELDVRPIDFLNNTPNAVALMNQAKELNLSLAANGSMYTKETKGILPELMEFLMVGRKKAKDEMLRLENIYQETKDESLQSLIAMNNAKQLAFKTGANAGYGAIGQEGFHYYDYRIAEAITLTGQLSDIHLANSLNVKMNSLLKTKDVDYIIAGDTDSVYMHVQALVDKFCANESIKKTVKFIDNFSSQVCQGIINSSVSDIYENMNAYEKLMGSKREAIASKGLFRGKKNYAMYVHNSEGVEYNPPKLKVMGIEIVRASTPQVCRKWLKECLQMMFETGEEELRTRYNKIKTEFFALEPNKIAFPRGLSDIDKWEDKVTIYKSRTPIHVRGALLHNHYMDGQRLQNGDKLKFIYLKVPNTIRENVISWGANDKFPDEKLSKYIDFDTQFEKSFKGPLESLTKCAGWELEIKATLEDFFG